MINLYELHAREKGRLPDNWFAYRYEALLGGGIDITGATAPLFVKGKRKGRPNFAKKEIRTKAKVHISVEDHEKWKSAWSQKTGLCNICVGEGRIIARFNVVTGAAYKPCEACNGTGKVKQ